MDLSHRSTLPEAMDEPGLSNAEYGKALADLANVNRITLTHRPALRWLGWVTRGMQPGTHISVLDVASGYGDLLRTVNRWATRRGLRHNLTGVDMNPRSGIEAAAATSRHMNIAWVTSDVFAYEPDPLPDFIVTSQFTHHLTDDQVVELLRWMERHAALGWLIVDLHRHWIPYYGFRILARIMRWHPITRDDGTISVARSFRKHEWQALLQRAGIEARVRWVFPFRLCVSRLK